MMVVETPATSKTSNKTFAISEKLAQTSTTTIDKSEASDKTSLSFQQTINAQKNNKEDDHRTETALEHWTPKDMVWKQKLETGAMEYYRLRQRSNRWSENFMHSLYRSNQRPEVSFTPFIHSTRITKIQYPDVSPL